MRYFIQLSYNGQAYHGWQYQPNAITVQEVLEKALSILLRAPVAVMGAGRTDAGVHAREMFAHFDVDVLIDIQALVFRLNAFLPEDIAVHAIRPVTDEAHARFSALERTYEYWITSTKNPFYTHLAHRVQRPLDFDAMNIAASLLLEHTNFACFSKSHTDVKTFICELRQAFWTKREDLWVFTISANRFLRNMVRAIVGTLLNVGLGKYPPEAMHRIVASENRSQAGVSVPAKGLYLTRVQYPKSLFV